MVKILRRILLVILILESMIFLHASAIMLYFAYFDRILFDNFNDKIKFGEYLIKFPIFSELQKYDFFIYFYGSLFAFFMMQYELIPKKYGKIFLYISLAMFIIEDIYFSLSENWTY